MSRKKIFIGTLICFSFLSSCYKDNLEELNPQLTCTDTANVTYSTTISPIMSASCTVCHSGSSPSGNLSLDTYTSVKNAGLSGKLYGSVSWDGTASQMPKGGSKLTDCSIAKIKKWIDSNYPQ